MGESTIWSLGLVDPKLYIQNVYTDEYTDVYTDPKLYIQQTGIYRMNKQHLTV